MQRLRRVRRALSGPALSVLAVVVGACALLENPLPVPPPPPPMPAGPAGRPQLLRGINLGNALDAPHEGEWGVTLEESDFVRVRAAGFDHVRLPVRFSGHAEDSPPYAVDEGFLRRVDWAIRQALGHGLAIVLDMHAYEDIMKEPDANRARFVGMWSQLAQ